MNNLLIIFRKIIYLDNSKIYYKKEQSKNNFFEFPIDIENEILSLKLFKDILKIKFNNFNNNLKFDEDKLTQFLKSYVYNTNFYSNNKFLYISIYRLLIEEKLIIKRYISYLDFFENILKKIYTFKLGYVPNLKRQRNNIIKENISNSNNNIQDHINKNTNIYSDNVNPENINKILNINLSNIRPNNKAIITNIGYKYVPEYNNSNLNLSYLNYKKIDNSTNTNSIKNQNTLFDTDLIKNKASNVNSINNSYYNLKDFTNFKEQFFIMFSDKNNISTKNSLSKNNNSTLEKDIEDDEVLSEQNSLNLDNEFNNNEDNKDDNTIDNSNHNIYNEDNDTNKVVYDNYKNHSDYSSKLFDLSNRNSTIESFDFKDLLNNSCFKEQNKNHLNYFNLDYIISKKIIVDIVSTDYILNYIIITMSIFDAKSDKIKQNLIERNTIGFKRYIKKYKYLKQ